MAIANTRLIVDAYRSATHASRALPMVPGVLSMRALLIADTAFDPMVLDTLLARGYDPIHRIQEVDRGPASVYADLVVIDFNVFGQSLIDLVRAIRTRQSTVQILALVRRAHAPQRIAVLDAGADACLSRPVDPIELRARIGALERRGRDIVHLGRLTWDWDSRQGEIGSTSIALSCSETVVLEALLRTPSQIVPISRLERLLASEVVRTSHNCVYVYICRLRKKLVSSGLRIKSVSGVGYTLGPAPLDLSDAH